MKGLLLDTSSSDAIIALSNQGHLLQFTPPSSSKISSTLPSHIQKLLQESETPLNQLSYIAVGIGPGSFLGTRIGVMVAKSLSYGLKIPLISFCSLQAYQAIYPGEFHVISDAKSKGAYLLKGIKNQENTLLYDESPSLYTPEELKQFIQDNSTFITPHKEELVHRMPFLSSFLISSTPHLPYLCKYCYEKYSLSEIETLDSLSIHYLRLS
jgi:tRNA threonylcarbamoyladenosine biosynthesis protein TsaB